MNTDKFLDRWRNAGVTKQLATILAALVAGSPDGEVIIDMDSLDDIAPGQTVIYYEQKGKIHLRFSGEYTTLYTIEDNVHERGASWTTQTATPSAHSSTSIPTDEQLADLEESRDRQLELQRIAREKRIQPIYTSDQPEKATRRRNQ